jgi:hypothetical protein
MKYISTTIVLPVKQIITGWMAEVGQTLMCPLPHWHRFWKQLSLMPSEHWDSSIGFKRFDYEAVHLTQPVTVAEWSRACTVFAPSEDGILGSNPIYGMDIWCVCVCVRLLSVRVVLCLGGGLATSWSPVQEVLPSVKRSWHCEINPMLQKWEQDGSKIILTRARQLVSLEGHITILDQLLST